MGINIPILQARKPGLKDIESSDLITNLLNSDAGIQSQDVLPHPVLATKKKGALIRPRKGKTI
jgi:hypothetical protein